MKFNICFIGGGNMATSMIAGLVADGFNANDIVVYDRNQDKLDNLSQCYGVRNSQDLQQAVSECYVIVLAVKPQQAAEVIYEIKSEVKQKNHLFVTVAAGLSMSVYDLWFGFDVAIARVMPNTPTSIQCGASGIYFNKHVSLKQQEMVEYMMRTMGVVVSVDEEDKIDVVTACAGSAPAYFFLFMEGMIAEAKRMGLTEQQAKLLVTQTALGSARMAISSDDSIEVLRTKITSKGGTTAEALRVYNEQGLSRITSKAMQAVVNRAKELAKMFIPRIK